MFCKDWLRLFANNLMLARKKTCFLFLSLYITFLISCLREQWLTWYLQYTWCMLASVHVCGTSLWECVVHAAWIRKDGTIISSSFNVEPPLQKVDQHKTNIIWFPADTRRVINVGSTLVHRLRRWTNVKQTLIQRLVSAGVIVSCFPFAPRIYRLAF